ncbi:MAG: Crp/Fnr family transcriptional regulator [Actinobacteria bacterium]|nr:Crp/Fnr family transcriptional regulator [Actinomycetota bacterium]
MDGNDRELIEVLKQASLFEGLDEAHIGQLVRLARRRSLDPGQTLFLQGDRAEGLHVVLAGRVKVFKTSKGREQILMLMGKGDPVGEVAVLSGEAYPASSEAIEPSEVLYIPRQAFLDLIAREPEVAMRLLAALSARLRRFTTLIEDLSLREVAERLAAHLLALAGEAGGDVVHLEVSKTQLSAAVGTVPETLSRAFKQLSLSGAVETRGRRVHIKNKELLEKVARAR